MAKKKWRYVKTGPLSGHWVYGSSDDELDNKADTVSQVDINRGVAPEDSSKGFLGSIFSNIGESLLGEGFSDLNLGESLKSWLDSMSGADMTNAQKQQNEFDANQAQINRDFQSKEAELAFERQVEFYEEYQSIGAQLRQYRENGLNPALLAGGVSPTSSGGASSAAQGSAAHSSPMSNNPMALVSFVMQMLGKKAEIDNIKADTKQKESEEAFNIQKTLTEREHTAEVRALTDEISTRTKISVDKWNMDCNKIWAEIEEINSRSDLNEAKKEESIANKLYAEAQAAYQTWQNDTAALRYWTSTGFYSLSMGLSALVQTGVNVVNVKSLIKSRIAKSLNLPNGDNISGASLDNSGSKGEYWGEIVDILDTL